MRTTALRWFRPTSALAATVAALALGACADRDPAAPDPDPGPPALAAGGADLNRALAELRRATARYHKVDAATADGFVEFGCEGSAGLVYVHPGRVDGTTDPSRPEALLYDVDGHGRLTLSGVELVIPTGAWPSADPPTFFGAPFASEDGGAVWALHVWVWRSNPNGMFAEQHPRVSCSP